MKITSKQLPKNQVEITVEVPVEKLDKYLTQAVEKIAKNIKIDGFRSGKIPYNIIKQRIGEMSIYQEALDFIIRDTLFEALEQEKIDAVGQPQIDIDKLAPENPVIYRATLTLFPKVEVKDYKNISAKRKEIKAEEQTIERTLGQLQKMRAQEVVADKAVEMGDKVVIDFAITLDKVPIEGGQHKDYPAYIGENFFVPGFEENLIGMKKGEEKTFELKFPKEYFQKNLAGKNTEVKVFVKEIFQVTKPELNDEFALSIGGFENVQALREQIIKNIEQEEKTKDEQRVELEILDQIIKNSQFDEIPQVMIEGELEKMIGELRMNILQQGMDFENYLMQIKSDESKLKEGFTPQAEKRLQTSLVIRKIAELENILAVAEEIEEEVNRLLKNIQDSKEKEYVKSAGYKNYLENFITNRKVIEKLKEWNLK
jgi:trigger factor